MANIEKEIGFMGPRITIHVGIHRTGTTALQNLLANNRELLKRGGVLYPFEATNHQQIAWSLFRGELTGADLVAKLEGEITPETRQIVLSAEDFAIHKDLSWLASLRARFDCEAIIYLRRQDEWMMSWYNQHVKWPFDRQKSRMSPEEFLLTLGDYHWLHYDTLLDRWSGLLGEACVQVGVMERAGLRDTSEDFLRRTAIGPLPAPKGNGNESIPAAALAILRHLSIVDLPTGQRIALQRALREAVLPKMPKGMNIYPSHIRNRIIDLYAESNAAVAHRYLKRSDGVLFKEQHCPPDAPYDKCVLPPSEELLSKHIAPLIGRLAALAVQQSGRATKA